MQKNLELETTILKNLSVLEPSTIQLIDESEQHIGHQGVRERGGRHYALSIASKKFDELSLVQSHRLIYGLLGDLMKKEIHALKINIKKLNRSSI